MPPAPDLGPGNAGPSESRRPAAPEVERRGVDAEFLGEVGEYLRYTAEAAPLHPTSDQANAIFQAADLVCRTGGIVLEGSLSSEALSKLSVDARERLVKTVDLLAFKAQEAPVEQHAKDKSAAIPKVSADETDPRKLAQTVLASQVVVHAIDRKAAGAYEFAANIMAYGGDMLSLLGQTQPGDFNHGGDEYLLGNISAMVRRLEQSLPR